MEYWTFVDYILLMGGVIFVASKLGRQVAAEWRTAVLGLCSLWVSQRFGLEKPGSPFVQSRKLSSYTQKWGEMASQWAKIPQDV